MRRRALVLALVSVLSSSPADAAAPGRELRIATTESMAYLVSYWLIALKKESGDVPSRVETTDADSVPMLIARGEATIGAMTRSLTAAERDTIRQRLGAEPIELAVAEDALAVYVHRDNPVPGMTLAQLDAVFSVERRCGYGENIFWWDQLGANTGEWKIRQIELFGPGVRAGARSVFADRALCGGTHKATLEMARNTVELLQTIAGNRAAITYGSHSLGLPAGVRPLPLAKSRGSAFVAPSAETITARTYPLVRRLYLIAPARRNEPETALLALALSTRGQQLVGVNRFASLESGDLEKERAKLR